MCSSCVPLSLQHWSNISISVGHSVEWPTGRLNHAAAHLSGSLFAIVGGEVQHGNILNDMWLCDTTLKLREKVYVCSAQTTCMQCHKCHALEIISCSHLHSKKSDLLGSLEYATTMFFRCANHVIITRENFKSEI